MKKFLFVIIPVFFLFILSCAPVLRKEVMDVAIRDVSFSDIKQNPAFYRGKIFVLGGIIVNTRATPEDSLIEALYVPVDSRGYLKGVGTLHNRFLAIFPMESGLLDPMVFRPQREITLAGEFIGTREGKIDEMDYVYPLFRIKELYLWEEKKEYYIVPYYYEPYPYWWDYPYWGYRPYWRWRHSVPPPYWW
ncbi:MAG: Slp family lipoprotein [Nitrospirae bacterium]|jgi:outer membrane lipoprotein|nr:Slp family lipoprotein [Nitrospirota bacterium]